MYYAITAFGIFFIFLSSTLGAALVYCFKQELSPKINAVFLGLASGIMIAAGFFSLLLPAIEQAQNTGGRYAIIAICISFLCGAFFLWIFDKCFPQSGKMRNKKNLDKKSKRLFLAVTLHNIPESLAVGFAFGNAWANPSMSAFWGALGVAIGIGIQNFPEGAAISLPMRTALKSKNKAFFYGVCSGAVEPIFAVLGCIFAAFLSGIQAWLLAFSAGAMIFVVAQDLLPDVNAEGIDGGTVGAWGCAVGFAMMMLLDVALS